MNGELTRCMSDHEALFFLGPTCPLCELRQKAEESAKFGYEQQERARALLADNQRLYERLHQLEKVSSPVGWAASEAEQNANCDMDELPGTPEYQRRQEREIDQAVMDLAELLETNYDDSDFDLDGFYRESVEILNKHEGVIQAARDRKSGIVRKTR